MSYLNELDELSTKLVDFKMCALSEELEALREFKRKFPGTSDEWKKSAVFLKEKQLRKHAKDLASEKQVNLSIWPLEYINWDKAVEDIKKKCETIILDDIKYWVIKK